MLGSAAYPGQARCLRAEHQSKIKLTRFKPNTVLIPVFSSYSFLAQGFRTRIYPQPWVRYGRSNYYISKTKKNWFSAEKYCEVRNSHLASILSYEEQVLYFLFPLPIFGVPPQSHLFLLTCACLLLLLSFSL